MENNNKNKFEVLAGIIQDMLGCLYDVKFYNNDHRSWSEILKEPDEMVHGVVVPNAGTNIKVGGQRVTVDQIIVNFIVPCGNKKVFDTNINNLYEKLPLLHNQGFEIAETSYNITYQSATAYSKEVVNGFDYAKLAFALSLVEFQSVILAKYRVVQIYNESTQKYEELEGVLNSTFNMQKTTEGEVYGLKSPVQKNDITGVVTTLDLDVVFYRDNAMHLDLMKSAGDINKIYKIAYFNGVLNRHLDMFVVAFQEQALSGDKLTGKLTLAIGG